MERHGFHIDRWSDDDLFLYLAQYGLGILLLYYNSNLSYHLLIIS